MTEGAVRAQGLLSRAEAANHLRCPLHVMPIGGLLVAEVARKAGTAAGEAQPPVAVLVMLACASVRQSSALNSAVTVAICQAFTQ